MKDFVSFIDGKIFELILIAIGFLISKAIDSRKTNPIKRYIKKYHYQHFYGGSLLLLYMAPVMYIPVILSIVIYFKIETLTSWCIASSLIIGGAIAFHAIYHSLFKLVMNVLVTLSRKIKRNTKLIKSNSLNLHKKTTHFLLIITFNFIACYFIFTIWGFTYQYLYDNRLIHLQGITLLLLLITYVGTSYFIIRLFNNATDVNYVVRIKTVSKDIELGSNHEISESSDAITIIQKTEDSIIENALILYKSNIISIDVISEIMRPNQIENSIENKEVS